MQARQMDESVRYAMSGIRVNKGLHITLLEGAGMRRTCFELIANATQETGRQAQGDVFLKAIHGKRKKTGTQAQCKTSGSKENNTCSR